MANRITSVFDFKSTGLSKVKADIAGADGAWNKAKVGFQSATEEFKQSRGAQLAAIGAIGAVAAKSISAASDLEESVNAVNVAYGENAEAVHQIGESSAEAFGMSQSSFNAFAVQFSSFAKTIAEKEGRDVSEVLGEITTRVADFASVNNLDMARASEVFMSTMAGSAEVARQFGVDVGAATVETHLLNNGMVESKGAITEADKVLGRYQVLMSGTANTAGDFKNTQDSLANATRIMQAQMEDLQAELGQHLIPALSEATAQFNQLLGVAKDLKVLDLAPEFAEWAMALQQPYVAQKKAREVTTELKASLDDLGETYEQVRANALAMGASEEEATKAARAAAGAYGTASEGLIALEREQKRANDAQEAGARHMARSENAARNLAWANQELTDEVEDAEEAVDDLTDSFSDLKAEMSDRSAYLDAEDAVDDVRDAYRELIAAQEEYGTESEQAEAASRNMERALMDLKQDVIDYAAEVEGIPEQEITEILAMIDQGNLAGAEQRLAALERDRVFRVKADTSGIPSWVRATNASGSTFYGAEGGIVTRPTMALIGEAGPEAVVPLNKAPGASPLPSGSGIGSGSGGGNTYHIEVKTLAVTAETQRAIENAVHEIERKRKGMM